MNRAAEVIEYFARHPDAEMMVLAPMAPPVVRRPDSLVVALSMVLDAADINDTLVALRSRSRLPESVELGHSGFFSFGLKEIGRFRVTYISQRGSKVVAVARIPLAIPDLHSVCPDADTVEALLRLASDVGPGLLLILGAIGSCNSLVAYALLQHVNRHQKKIIHCIEPMLSFLMRHDNSVVIQTEIDIDVPTLETAIRLALPLRPHLVFVGALRAVSDLRLVEPLIEAGSLVIGSLTTWKVEAALDWLEQAQDDPLRGVAARRLRVLHVRSDTGGALSLRLLETAPDGARRTVG